MSLFNCSKSAVVATLFKNRESVNYKTNNDNKIGFVAFYLNREIIDPITKDDNMFENVTHTIAKPKHLVESKNISFATLYKNRERTHNTDDYDTKFISFANLLKDSRRGKGVVNCDTKSISFANMFKNIAQDTNSDNLFRNRQRYCFDVNLNLTIYYV